MTKARGPQTVDKPSRKPSVATSTAAQAADVCEHLLAELQGHRERLQKLLHLVKLDAVKVSADASRGQRYRCNNPRMRRPA
jgi:hypothetical protein